MFLFEYVPRESATQLQHDMLGLFQYLFICFLHDIDDAVILSMLTMSSSQLKILHSSLMLHERQIDKLHFRHLQSFLLYLSIAPLSIVLLNVLLLELPICWISCYL
jgi:hypothetical protein